MALWELWGARVDAPKFGELPLLSCGLLPLQQTEHQGGAFDVRMSDCAVHNVWWVKVGYSLLLGHVSNPTTLAWILIPDPFSSNKRSWPPGLSYRCQRARAARRSFHIVATLKWLPVPPCSPFNHHPTDVYFSGLSPNSILVTSATVVAVSAMSQQMSARSPLFEAEKVWVSVESEPQQSLGRPWRFAFGRPVSCWQKQQRPLHLRDTYCKSRWNMSPRSCSRVKLTWRWYPGCVRPPCVPLHTVVAHPARKKPLPVGLNNFKLFFKRNSLFS